MEVAAHLDISQGRVSQLADRGVLPRADRGQWDLDECRREYLAHLEQRAREAMATNALAQSRTRLAAAQADRQAMLNHERRQQLLPASEVKVVWPLIVQHCRNVIMTIPGKVASKVAALNKASEIELVLEAAVYDALSHLGRTHIAPAPDDGQKRDN